MAKRKIVWSNRAIKRLYGIFESCNQREENKTYSKKLYPILQKGVKVLIKFPDTGLKTTERTTRGLIIEDYIIFYQITEDKIIIHTVWHSGQNPGSRIIK